MWIGVNLFFLASGFINGSKLLYNNNRYKFVISRIARILPLYITYMIIGTSCWYTLKNDFFYSDDYQIYKPWLFLTGLDFFETNLGPSFFSITWSLSVEIQLYFLIFLLTFMSKNINIFVSTLLVILGIITPFFYSNHFGLIMHLDEFFIGVLMRHYYDKNKFLAINRFHLIKFGIIFIIILFSEFSKVETDIGNPLFDFFILIAITSLFIFLHNNSF